MTRSRPTGHVPKRRSLPALAVAAIVLVSAGCDQDGPVRKKKKPLPMVKTTTAEVKPLTVRLELTGSIEPIRVARMASPVEGPVMACPVREGDRVRTGQLLARLGRTKGDDAAAASARAELQREELELDRVKELVETGALPGEELDETRVRVSEAQARLARAMEKLGDYRIAAPWNGLVSRVHVAVGDFVSARATLVELFDPESLVLRFAVPEDSAARVQHGASVAVELDAHPGRSFSAEVTRIYPEIDRRTHTRTVEADITGDVALFPGMFARLRLTLASVPEALAVPAVSVLRKDGRQVVFVIPPDNKAVQRIVETGIEDGDWVQILDGVARGERVAVAGHTRLRSGKKVRLAGKRNATSAGKRPDGKRAPGKNR